MPWYLKLKSIFLDQVAISVSKPNPEIRNYLLTSKQTNQWSRDSFETKTEIDILKLGLYKDDE